MPCTYFIMYLFNSCPVLEILFLSWCSVHTVTACISFYLEFNLFARFFSLNFFSLAIVFLFGTEQQFSVGRYFIFTEKSNKQSLSPML